MNTDKRLIINRRRREISWPILIIVLLLAVAVTFAIYHYQTAKINQAKTPVPAVAFNNNAVITAPAPEKTVPAEETKPPTPASYLLKVPFQSQAPFGDWSEPWENACEEASIVMVKYYFDGAALPKEQMKVEIQNLVDYQIQNWGSHSDLNATKTLKLAQNYYHLPGKVVTGYSVDTIKEYISQGIPVIAPTEGQYLGNPNFRGAGPPYHMLVIKGYDQNNFITNDPGTRNGESYVYSYQTLLDAVSGPNKNMAKELIVLSKN